MKDNQKQSILFPIVTIVLSIIFFVVVFKLDFIKKVPLKDISVAEISEESHPIVKSDTLGTPVPPVDNLSVSSLHDNKIDLMLFQAASEYNTKDLDQYIKDGGDVNYSDSHGVTALMRAAEYVDDSVLNILLSNGAHVNAKDDMGKTAIFYAVSSNSLNNVETLIDNGADLSLTDDKGNTVLYYALNNDNMDIIDLLEQHGAPQ